eukprot:EG_transcript_5647
MGPPCFPDVVLRVCDEIVAVVGSSYGPHGRLKATVNDLGQVTFTSRGVAIVTRLAIAHPAALLLRRAARAVEARAGDGTTTFLLLLTAWLRALCQHAPAAHPALRRRYFTAMAHALGHLQAAVFPAEVAPALYRMGRYVSVADEEGAAMPPWREASMLLLHTHLCTGMSRPLATVLTHLLCELIGCTIRDLQRAAGAAAAGPRPGQGVWHTAVIALASARPVVAAAGGPLEASAVVPGLFLDAAPLSSHMPHRIATPHRLLALTAPLLPALKAPDGTPVGDADASFAANAQFSADAQTVLAAFERYAAAFIARLAAAGVHVLLSRHRLPDCVATACVQHRCLAAHCVDAAAIHAVCGAAGVLPLADLPTTEELLSWEIPAAHLAPLAASAVVACGSGQWLRLELAAPVGCAHTLLLRCPAQVLCEEYRTVVERALLCLAHAAAAEPPPPHQLTDPPDPAVPGVWVVGGGAAPLLRCALALGEEEGGPPPPAGRHPDFAGALRVARRGLREALLSVARGLAHPEAPGTALRLVQVALQQQRADATGNVGLIATISSPALIPFADVAATSELPLEVTGVLQPLDALVCGVYDPLPGTLAVLHAVAETLTLLLRIDAPLPALHVPAPRGEAHGSAGSDTDDD